MFFNRYCRACFLCFASSIHHIFFSMTTLPFIYLLGYCIKCGSWMLLFLTLVAGLQRFLLFWAWWIASGSMYQNTTLAGCIQLQKKFFHSHIMLKLFSIYIPITYWLTIAGALCWLWPKIQKNMKRCCFTKFRKLPTPFPPALGHCKIYFVNILPGCKIHPFALSLHEVNNQLLSFLNCVVCLVVPHEWFQIIFFPMRLACPTCTGRRRLLQTPSAEEVWLVWTWRRLSFATHMPH